MNKPLAKSMPEQNMEELTVREVSDLATAGNDQARARLRTWLEQNPNIAKQYGDLVGMAREALLGRLAKTNSLVAESVRLSLEQLKKELMPANPSAVHLLAADRVVLLQAEIHLLDALYPLVSELEPVQARVVAKAKDSAQRRYGLALKTLAAVNKLLPGSRQVPRRNKSNLATVKFQES